MDKKIVYIPGWMDRMRYHSLTPDLDIWGSEVDYKEKIDADYIVAYSLGTNFTLLNWQINQNAKLILINPLLKKKKIWHWMMRHWKFLIFEGADMRFRRLRLFSNPYSFLKRTLELIRVDSVEIISKIPREKILIIRGTKDDFFCDTEVANWVRSKNIPLIEIDGVGHEWKDEFKTTVEKVLSGE